MDLDTDVLIIGAGLSGLGLAVQLVRQYGHRNFELIEKTGHIGGTWLANSYPGCGVDVRCIYSSIILHVAFNKLTANQLTAGGCALLLLFILLEPGLDPEISIAARDSRLPQASGCQVRYRKACQIPLHRQLGPLGRVLAHVVGHRHRFEGFQDVQSPVQNTCFCRRHPLPTEWV